jgi:hypothetical protein
MTTDQVTISMDWLPTLVAAAVGSVDPQYPPDGVNLLPLLAADVPALPRRLFWRYKGNAQRAARGGDFKYLKILDNTFLFNVVQDPMERANLKERRRDIYDRLTAGWLGWNEAMLSEIEESFTGADTGDTLADRPGSKEMKHKPDNLAPVERSSGRRRPSRRVTRGLVSNPGSARRGRHGAGVSRAPSEAEPRRRNQSAP